MNIFTPDTDLNKLNSDFRKKVDLFLPKVYAMGVFVTEAYRGNARQKWLRSIGHSKVKVSNHQLGLAIDIAFSDDLRTLQKERELYPEDVKRWREVADIAKSCGIDWGYDLWQWDKPHFQDDGQRFIHMMDMKHIDENNKIFAQRGEAVREALQEFNAVTKQLCELKNKEFVPYTIERFKHE
jgi:hypothetical protein